MKKSNGLFILLVSLFVLGGCASHSSSDTFDRTSITKYDGSNISIDLTGKGGKKVKSPLYSDDDIEKVSTYIYEPNNSGNKFLVYIRKLSTGYAKAGFYIEKNPEKDGYVNHSFIGFVVGKETEHLPNGKANYTADAYWEDGDVLKAKHEPYFVKDSLKANVNFEDGTIEITKLKGDNNIDYTRRENIKGIFRGSSFEIKNTEFKIKGGFYGEDAKDIAGTISDIRTSHIDTHSGVFVGKKDK